MLIRSSCNAITEENFFVALLVNTWSIMSVFEFIWVISSTHYSLDLWKGCPALTQVSLAKAGTIRKLHLSSLNLRLPLKVLLPPSTKPPRENFWPPIGNAADWVIRLRKALSGKPNRMRLSDFSSVFSTYPPHLSHAWWPKAQGCDFCYSPLFTR